MLKKLLAWGSVLVVAALLAVPAFADPADLSSEWGSDQWLIDQFGANGDITSFCKSIKRKDQTSWRQQFPNLPGLCGWSQPQESSANPQASQPEGSSSQDQTTPPPESSHTPQADQPSSSGSSQ
jgi:hypothetical protein